MNQVVFFSENGVIKCGVTVFRPLLPLLPAIKTLVEGHLKKCNQRTHRWKVALATSLPNDGAHYTLNPFNREKPLFVKLEVKITPIGDRKAD